MVRRERSDPRTTRAGMTPSVGPRWCTSRTTPTLAASFPPRTGEGTLELPSLEQFAQPLRLPPPCGEGSPDCGPLMDWSVASPSPLRGGGRGGGVRLLPRTSGPLGPATSTILYRSPPHHSSSSHLMRGPRLVASITACSLGPRVEPEGDEPWRRWRAASGAHGEVLDQNYDAQILKLAQRAPGASRAA
jgi:hypothetical protein